MEVEARYFVIHDTSTPNLKLASAFPPEINDASWDGNAFHAAVDAGLTDGHDDPQRFSLEQWADAVESIAVEIGRPDTVE